MTWLFSIVVLLGSCMLFLVQPLCAKMLLPHLGGTPAVWTTCMLFFQAGLLAGYAYAHFLPRWMGVRMHAFVHVFLMLSAFALLPIRFPEEMPGGWHPIVWLLVTMTTNAGLPFMLIAAQAPLMQRWFVATLPRDPYFLYAASNLGSFLALGLFPFALEPFLSLSEIADGWKFAFIALTAITACCIPLAPLSPAGPATPTAPPDRRMLGRWTVLALIPSSLLLSVTTYATTDLAAIPLLWLIPMGIYLLTYILAFSGQSWLSRHVLVRWLPLVVLVLVILILCERPDPLFLVLALHLAGFFWLALACHAEVARTRPAAEHLTAFYLCLAMGGVLGGLLNAIAAPLLFWDLLEYPLMIVLACYLVQDRAVLPTWTDAKWTLAIGGLAVVLVIACQSSFIGPTPPGPLSVGAMFGLPLLLCYTTQAMPARFACCMAAVLAASGLYHGNHGLAAYRERSFLGVHRVSISDSGMRRLVHGNTVHGQQNPVEPNEPLTYYGREGPVGELLTTLAGDPRLQRVGVVGLGAGSLAAYAEAGQHWTFFEIDSVVTRIAENSRHFTFVHEARRRATFDIELGDGRLQLRQSRQMFGVLVIDAFGSDAIPLHLLTREAMAIYLNRLQPHGILAMHISNRYVDLEPVLASLATDANPPLVCRVKSHQPSVEAKAAGVFPSEWAVIVRSEASLPETIRTWPKARTRPGLKAWTDQSSNLLQALR